MSERGTIRGLAEWGLRAFLFALAIACTLTITIVPDWERDLHAENYQEFSTISSEALKDAEAERRDVTNRLEQTRQEPRKRPWGAFLSLDRNTISRSRSRLENGFDAETPGFLAGVDRRLSDTLLLGVVGGFKVTDLSFDDVSSRDRFGDAQALGHQRTYTGTIGPYLSYTPDAAWYADGSAIGGVLRTSTDRAGDGLRGQVRGDTSGYRFSLAAGGGYDWRRRGLRLGPHLGVAWDHVHVDGFAESGTPADARMLLRVPGSDDELVTLKSGGGGSYVVPVPWGAVLPHWRADFVYRTLGQSRTGRVTLLDGTERTFLRDVPDRTSMEVGLGLQFLLAGELSFWIDYQENFLERFYTRTRLTIGVRKQF